MLQKSVSGGRLMSAADIERILSHFPESVVPTRGPVHGPTVKVARPNVITETLHLLSVPGMREAIKEGLETPFEDCAKELGW